MVALKFVGAFCLVYFTIFVNAGKRICEEVIDRLDKLNCTGQGTLGNAFYLTVVFSVLNLSAILNLHWNSEQWLT